MTPYEAVLRFLVNNPQPMALDQMAAAVVAVLAHGGFLKEMTDAE